MTGKEKGDLLIQATAMTFVLSVFIGFSLNNWLATNNYTRTVPLPLMVSADLLTHLNVQTYLKQPSWRKSYKNRKYKCHQVLLIFCVIEVTIKPVLRGHPWDKEKLVF
jgi:hypothetical protein